MTKNLLKTVIGLFLNVCAFNTNDIYSAQQENILLDFFVKEDIEETVKHEFKDLRTYAQNNSNKEVIPTPNVVISDEEIESIDKQDEQLSELYYRPYNYYAIYGFSDNTSNEEKNKKIQIYALNKMTKLMKPFRKTYEIVSEYLWKIGYREGIIDQNLTEELLETYVKFNTACTSITHIGD